MGNAHGPSEITVGLGNQALFLSGRTHLIISSQSIDFDVWCMKVYLNREAVRVRATQIFTSGAVLQKLSNLQVHPTYWIFQMLLLCIASLHVERTWLLYYRKQIHKQTQKKK